MRVPRNWERLGIPLCIALMWVGLFWSRALLSIGMMLFILLALLTGSFSEKLQLVRRTPFLAGMTLLFLIPCITIFWSSDLRWWLKVMQDKLPLLAMPFCCGSLLRLEEQTRRRLVLFALTVVFLSMGKSTIVFLLQYQEVTEGYLKAKVMAVDMHGDHVRYGWLLSLVFAWLLHAATADRAGLSQREQQGIVLLASLIAAYLHLLASKTGLLGLYLSLGIWFLYHRRVAFVRWVAAASLLLPGIAWMLLPTFRNRLRFIRWDFQHYTRGSYTEGLSDTPRILSFDAGRSLTSQHPWLGTGFGDLRRSMNEWYALHAPFMKAYEQLLPSNEVLLHAAAAGIPLAIVVLAIILRPLWMRSHRRSGAWISFHAIALAGFQYEIGLETQYGIFFYAFLGCWAWLFAANPPRRNEVT